jgi:hypothetical protein
LARIDLGNFETIHVEPITNIVVATDVGRSGLLLTRFPNTIEAIVDPAARRVSLRLNSSANGPAATDHVFLDQFLPRLLGQYSSDLT